MLEQQNINQYPIPTASLDRKAFREWWEHTNRSEEYPPLTKDDETKWQSERWRQVMEGMDLVAITKFIGAEVYNRIISPDKMGCLIPPTWSDRRFYYIFHN